ncbi:protein FAM185A isoform X1 [Rattus norvegicus]|uniref:Family with sequence similarity 185, member A n=1 Tax=Rattus norvegicus TaxID=10116 RepID=A0A8I6ASX3_RAT|nr:protein FAM185A isoform X2 [Rattus norvegicus]
MFGRLPPCASRVRAGALFGALGTRTCGSGGAERRGSVPANPGAGLARGDLREWTLRVSPFGRLRARLPCHLSVRPLDPLAHPDGDRVLVAVSGVGSGTRGLDSLQVKYDAALQEMAILSDDIDPEASVEVNAPVKFDLNIESSGAGSVSVQNIECDSCKIDTEQGTSILQSVKSQKLHVNTKGGDVVCLGTIYGNIDIHASDKSTVTIDKLQGSCVNISTEDGLLQAKYLYTDSSFVSSAAGDIALGNIHGNIVLESKMGNISVGSIAVKAPSSLRAHLKLSGKEVVVDTEAHVQEMAKDRKGDGMTVTGLMNQGSKCERWINAIAPKGTVRFQHQSWFQSLKLPN